MDKDDVIQNLNDLSDEIWEVDKTSATRLTQLAGILNQADYGQQVTLDLYGAFNPAGLEERAFASYQKLPYFLKYVEWVRNFLVLAPICLTWYGLWRASVSYERLISEQPEMITQPFLLLWERGFAELGTATSLTFSHVAFGDFIMLGFVFLLTIFVHWYRDVGEVNAEQKAFDLRRKLENVLWQVSQLFAEVRHAQDQGTVIVRFEQSVGKLVTALVQERKRLETLAKRREKEFGDLSALGTSLADGAKDLQEFSLNVQNVYAPFQNAILKLASHVEQVDKQQQQLVTTLETLNTRLNGLMSQAVVAGQSFQVAVDELGSSADRLTIYSGAATANSQQSGELLDGLTKQIDVITDNLREATHHTGLVSREMVQTMGLTNQVAQELKPALDSFEQHIDQLAQQGAQAIALLDQSGQSIQSAIGTLNNSAHDFSQQTKTLNRHLAQTVNQVNTIVNPLSTVGQQLQEATQNANQFSNFLVQTTTSLKQLERSRQQNRPNQSLSWAIGLLALLTLAVICQTIVSIAQILRPLG